MDWLNSLNWGEVAAFVALEGTFITGVWRIQSRIAHQDRRIDGMVSSLAGHVTGESERFRGIDNICKERHSKLDATISRLWEHVSNSEKREIEQ